MFLQNSLPPPPPILYGFTFTKDKYYHLTKREDYKGTYVFFDSPGYSFTNILPAPSGGSISIKFFPSNVTNGTFNIKIKAPINFNYTGWEFRFSIDNNQYGFNFVSTFGNKRYERTLPVGSSSGLSLYVGDGQLVPSEYLILSVSPFNEVTQSTKYVEFRSIYMYKWR